MTSFSSVSPEIEALRFDPIPTRRIKVARAVRVNRTIVFVDTAGRIYSSGVTDRVHYSLGYSGAGDTFEACVRLGIISKAARDAHRAYNDRVSEERNKRYSADSIKKNAETLGIKLTPAQLRVVNVWGKAS